MGPDIVPALRCECVGTDHEAVGVGLKNLLPTGVEDVAAAADKVRELGGTVLLEPGPDFRNGLQAVAVDPGGAIFALRQWTE